VYALSAPGQPGSGPHDRSLSRAHAFPRARFPFPRSLHLPPSPIETRERKSRRLFFSFPRAAFRFSVYEEVIAIYDKHFAKRKVQTDANRKGLRV
jgi:hypothetical protein